MTRRKERQARRNLALATGRALEMSEAAEEQVTRVGFASVSRVEAARREVELCATSEALVSFRRRSHPRTSGSYSSTKTRCRL
jgi:hypothetical protein